MTLLKCCTIAAFLVVPFITTAQNIAGTWIGDYKNVPVFLVKPEKVVLELYQYNDSLITGASHLYYTRNRFEHHKLSGKYNRADSTIRLSEDSILSYRYAGAKVCEGIFSMKLSVVAGKMKFGGRWKDKSRGLIHCPSVNVFVEKDFELQAAQPVPLMRASDIQHVLEISEAEKDSIMIQILDNGIVDGDTVSVLLDNKEIVSRHGITETPATFYFSLQHSLQKIKMVAENVGSIPPNTALLIITTKKKKYEIFLSSDMQKNAVVEFFLK